MGKNTNNKLCHVGWIPLALGMSISIAYVIIASVWCIDTISFALLSLSIVLLGCCYMICRTIIFIKESKWYTFEKINDGLNEEIIKKALSASPVRAKSNESETMHYFNIKFGKAKK